MKKSIRTRLQSDFFNGLLSVLIFEGFGNRPGFQPAGDPDTADPVDTWLDFCCFRILKIF